MTWQEVIEYYKGLIITQYRNKPKMQGTIGTLVDCSVCEGLPLQLQNTFDLTTCDGAQLEIIGRIVGVPRDVIGLDLTHTWFSFTRYDGEPDSVGFGVYTAQPDVPIFLRYRSDAIYTMTDFELKSTIYLRIIYNNFPATYKAVKEALYRYFGGGIDVVPGASVMTLIYNVNSVYTTTFLVANFLHTIPCPMGCSATINYI
jgi:hypothetical protein